MMMIKIAILMIKIEMMRKITRISMMMNLMIMMSVRIIKLRMITIFMVTM